MTEILPPLATTQSPPSPRSQTLDHESTNSYDALPRSHPDKLERVPSYAQKRMSQYSSRNSTTSQSSRPASTHSTNLEYPAFTSSLSYALVRDFAYPVFHPLHYGSTLSPSGTSTPTSTSNQHTSTDWNPARRQSAPDQQWFHSANTAAHVGGWSAGPWGGDGVMYGDPEGMDDVAAVGNLPSTSFSSTAERDVAPFEFVEGEEAFRKRGHRKSKSFGSIPEFERGRRRESGRRSRGGAGAGGGEDAGLLWQSHRESNGGRKDSRNSATTLPNRSFHTNSASTNHTTTSDIDSDEPIPLDAEPHPHQYSPQRSSMGPEDEELFAGPSLALYSFEPENSNELRLEEGQEIMVSYRHGQGWLVASDPETGEQGLVPEAYVRLIADMPNYDIERGGFVDEEEEEDYDDETGETTEGSYVEDGTQTDGQDVEKDVAAARRMVARRAEDEGEDVESPGRRGALSSTLFPV